MVFFRFFLSLLCFFIIYSPQILIGRFDVFLSRVLSSLGPAFVKFGQMLSTRADIIPVFLAKNLMKTQDDMPCESKKYIREVFLKNYNRFPEDIFYSFNYKAVSAASIAQVHFAISKSGEKFAVKILKKDIKGKIIKNIELLKYLISFLDSKFKNLQRFRLFEVVLVLEKNLLRETNMMVEAFSALKLKINLLNNKGVYIPNINFHLTTEDILIMEWIDSKSVSKISDWSEFNRKEVLTNLVNSFCDQAYKDGFFHADVHPGNIFIDNSKEHKNRIILIDFGSMGLMDLKSKFYITEILRGFLTKDYHLVARIHFEAGYVDSKYDMKKFEKACAQIGDKLIGKSLENVSIGEVFSSLLKLTSEFQIKTRTELLLIQKATILLEAVSKIIDNSSNIWVLSHDWLERNYMRPDQILFRKIKSFCINLKEKFMIYL